MSDVATLPVARAAEMKTGGAIKAVVPQSMDDAYRLAKAVCLSGLAPRGLEKPEAAMVAILHGLEIGLTPMMALQKISVINGRPTLWGDGALGLVRSSGLCKYVKEQIAGTGDARTATCETQRAGEPDPVVRTFSVADAKKAGLWGKAGPWQNFPDRMLQMRARAFALRDTYADVLGGMYLAEELQGTETASPPQHQPRLVPPPAPLAAPAEPAKVAITAEPVDDYRDWLRDCYAELAACQSDQAVEDLRDRALAQMEDQDKQDWKDACAARATELFKGGKH